MHFSEKTIKGKKYLYAVKSVRMPGGRIHKITKRVSSLKASGKELNAFFEEKEKDLLAGFAVKQFRKNQVFTESEIRKIEAMKFGCRKLVKKLGKSDWKDVLDRFTANFTFNSNAIEGNSLTLKDVELVMFSNFMPKGKDLREVFETRNSRKVVELIFKKKFKASHKGLIKMHALLMKDIDERKGYKQIPNELLGRRVKLTPPEKVEKEMSELIEFINENPERLHPLDLAAVSHGRFERIHPFADGNGRVGRFLINLILINNKYPPVIIRSSQRQAYLKALEDFDNSYRANLERFLLEKFKDTYRKFFEVYVKYLPQENK